MKASEYVSRCCDALDEYLRLRFLGVSHEGAQVQSGLLAAVQGREQKDTFDARKAQAGERE